MLCASGNLPRYYIVLSALHIMSACMYVLCFMSRMVPAGESGFAVSMPGGLD
jgi:hypothetical protein